MSMPAPISAYDLVEYPSKPISDCHPVRMASIAALAGLTPPAFDTGTVVDLGCGTAANLLSIAAAYPGVTAIGVDPSREAIARGQQLVDDAGLDNVTLVQDTRTPLEDGQADFVIAHGVLSWVDAATREAVIAEAARIARDGALVFFSYNAEPGALTRLLARRIGRRAGSAQLAAGDAQGAQTTLLHRLGLAAAGAEAGSIYARLAAAQHKYIGERDPQALFHDELNADWSAIAIADLAEQSLGHGLGYVGELRSADRWRTWTSRQDAEAIASLAGPSAAEQQQYLDDITGTQFHDSLFVKGAAPSPPTADGAAALPAECPAVDWHVRWTGREQPDETEPGRVAVFNAAREASAEGLSVGEVAERTGRDPSDVLAVASRLDARELLTLALAAPPAAQVPGDLPLASGLARAQARAGFERVTSLRHRNVAVVDAPLRLLLPLLDGTRDRTALAQALQASGFVAEGGDAGKAVNACLEAFTKSGFLFPTDSGQPGSQEA